MGKKIESFDEIDKEIERIAKKIETKQNETRKSAREILSVRPYYQASPGGFKYDRNLEHIMADHGDKATMQKIVLARVAAKNKDYVTAFETLRNAMKYEGTSEKVSKSLIEASLKYAEAAAETNPRIAVNILDLARSYESSLKAKK